MTEKCRKKLSWTLGDKKDIATERVNGNDQKITILTKKKMMNPKGRLSHLLELLNKVKDKSGPTIKGKLLTYFNENQGFSQKSAESITSGAYPKIV